MNQIETIAVGTHCFGMLCVYLYFIIKHHKYIVQAKFHNLASSIFVVFLGSLGWEVFATLLLMSCTWFIIVVVVKFTATIINCKMQKKKLHWTDIKTLFFKCFEEALE